MGSKKWVDLRAWPPPTTATEWFLRSEERLSIDRPSEKSGHSSYRYDPLDPTPSVGGAVRVNGGAKDNRKLEARSDVLTFTSEPMPHEVTIMGSVVAELHVCSSLENTDFYVRLCDVSRYRKKSINICDGIVRFAPSALQGDTKGIRRIVIEMSPTAHCFKVGHRIRLQVSSGAHPRHVRNLGTGEPIATGTVMRSADQQVFHNTSHPSKVILPVASLGSTAWERD